MERIELQPRPNWRTVVEELGFYFHSINGSYWGDNVCFRFSPREIAEIERATVDLHRCCMDAVAYVIENSLLESLGIPEHAWPLVVASWQRRDPHLYGRFDLSYDGVNPPKMLEYNADTPTALLEASVIQRQWRDEVRPGASQFNLLHKKLLQGWRKFNPASGVLHFCSIDGSEEDRNNVEYLRRAASEAGFATRFLHIEDIGWNSYLGRFVDLQDTPINTLFKLYPWEWMIFEDFADYIQSYPLRVIEPAWKMILSNKGILPILWKLFPDHPNLLPAYTDPAPLGDSYVRKPLLSREGANIMIVTPGETIESFGEYGEEGFIFQKYCPLPSFDGQYAAIGSWVIDDQAAGIGIRESRSLITHNMSQFVPHFVE
jgi:glutathionylspermidine synthase